MIHTIEDILKRLFGENNVRSCTIQPDHVFYTSDDNEELCHHTGFEILDGEDDPSNWWCVYVDMSGHYHLGR